MPQLIDRPRTLHSFMGLFHSDDFRSRSLFRDLDSMFGESTFFIVWDHDNAQATEDVPRYQRLQLQAITKDQLFNFISQFYAVDRKALVEDCRAFPLLLRILLAMYLRKVAGLDYCIMADNDIFIFEPIPEIVRLSEARTPFLIQETGAADTLPQITEYIRRHLGKEIRYIPPSKGKGYNAGFCGLDISVFDRFDSATVRLLLDTLRPMGEWWREQAFFVHMNFASPKRVHTFEDERYMFLPHDDRTYRQKSKIYHCIFTTDKRRVDLYYLLRYGRTIGDRLRVGGIWGVLLVQGLRKRLQVRTRIYRWLRLDLVL